MIRLMIFHDKQSSVLRCFSTLLIYIKTKFKLRIKAIILVEGVFFRIEQVILPAELF